MSSLQLPPSTSYHIAQSDHPVSDPAAACKPCKIKDAQCCRHPETCMHAGFCQGCRRCCLLRAGHEAGKACDLRLWVLVSGSRGAGKIAAATCVRLIHSAAFGTACWTLIQSMTVLAAPADAAYSHCSPMELRSMYAHVGTTGGRFPPCSCSKSELRLGRVSCRRPGIADCEMQCKLVGLTCSHVDDSFARQCEAPVVSSAGRRNSNRQQKPLSKHIVSVYDDVGRIASVASWV